MCLPQIMAPIMSALGGAGAAITGTAGAGAAGVTVGSALQTVGALVGIGGTIAQGISANSAARAQSRAIEEQRAHEAVLSATEDRRRRQAMTGQIAQQRAELAARGISLDSPSALLLGQTAAAEMSFESQAVRSGAAARQRELSAEARAVRARGQTALLKGGFSAAGQFLNAAPEIWPGFSERRIGERRLT